MIQDADLLLAFAVPFASADEGLWTDYCTRASWTQMLDVFDALLARTETLFDADARQALENVPSLAQHAAFAARHYTGGLPQSALPVESFYVDADAAIDGVSTGAHYLQQPAYYMKELASRLAIGLPEEFSAMPDHLSVELSVAASLARAAVTNGDRPPENPAAAAARDFLSMRFIWVDKYKAHLLSIPAMPAFYPALADAVVAATRVLAVSME